MGRGEGLAVTEATIGAPTTVGRRHEAPVFADPAEERLHVKQRLAGAFRILAALNLSEGLAGHITVRDPIRPDHFWVNPIGVSFRLIRASDLSLVDHAGNVVDGRWEVGRAAFAIHSRIHAARPEVAAACHSHSRYGRAWAAFGRPIAPLSQEACAFYEDLAVYDAYEGVVFDPGEGDRIAEALGHRKACIMRNHGLLTVGHTVDEAVWWFISLDSLCHSQLLAEAAGPPRALGHEDASLTHRQLGAPEFGWRSFQPLFDAIVAEQPDLLD